MWTRYFEWRWNFMKCEQGISDKDEISWNALSSFINMALLRDPSIVMILNGQCNTIYDCIIADGAIW